MVFASGTTPKSIERRVKKHPKMNHPKRHPFPGPGPYRKEKSLEKVGPKEPRGLPKESQGTPKPRKIAPERVSKYVLYPKWARTGSDCLRRRLLKGLRVHFGQFSDDSGWIFFDNAPRNVKKPLRHAELLPHVVPTRKQCHTAAAEGAQLSTIYLLHIDYQLLGVLYLHTAGAAQINSNKIPEGKLPARTKMRRMPHPPREPEA